MTQSRTPRVIGVTGITGSGASTVARLICEMTGAHYISADALAHEISARQDVQEEIRAAFGVSERKQLGAIVFADAGKMAQLEGIIHPRVIAATKAQLESTPHAVIDAPLLTEAGMHALCCEVWLVTAADDVRVQRLASRSGMPREEAMRRIHARRGDDYISPHATIIIENNGDITQLRAAVTERLTQ